MPMLQLAIPYFKSECNMTSRVALPAASCGLSPCSRHHVKAFTSNDRARCPARALRAQQTSCSAEPDYTASVSFIDRRQLLLATVALAAAPAASPAAAYGPVPAGRRRNLDVLDGYSFLYPDFWSAVTTSGNDIFYRNPYNVEENLFVNITSPSSSKYESVEDLGSPTEAAERLKQQYLSEFMSTRLGSQKKAEIVSAESRTADGRLYYDIQIRAQSLASRSPLASTQREIDANMQLEWDRQFLTTLGVANKRLYELRLQAPAASFEKNEAELRETAASFRCKEVDISA